MCLTFFFKDLISRCTCLCLILFSWSSVTSMTCLALPPGNAQGLLPTLTTPPWTVVRGRGRAWVRGSPLCGDSNPQPAGPNSHPLISANKVLWNDIHLHITHDSVLTLRQTCVLGNELLWSKIFTLWPFIGKVSWPLIYYDKVAKLS